MGLETEQKNWIIRFIDALAKADRAYQGAKDSMFGWWFCKRRRKA